jgi:hypothetical protein
MSAMPNALISRLLHEIRTSRLVQVSTLVLVLAAMTEGGLRWRDGLAATQAKHQALLAERSDLRAQVRDETLLRERIETLAEARRSADARVWRVPSEAIGQARVGDWLAKRFKELGIGDAQIKYSAIRPYQPTDDSAAKTVNATGSELREIRASVAGRFSPAGLEQLLLHLEGSETQAVVESLTVRRNERRFEMTIRFLLSIDRAVSPITGNAE